MRLTFAKMEGRIRGEAQPQYNSTGNLSAWRILAKRLFTFGLFHFLAFSGPVRASDADLCFVCGNPITASFYRVEDRVMLEARNVCKECEITFPACFVCGLPARTTAPGCQRISDGRVLCARDAQTAVLESDEGVHACRDAWEQINRLLSRFISFPDKNVRVRIVDRVHLLELFKQPGNDYECPNAWGFTQTRSEGAHFEHRVSILGAMPIDFFQATCAHEYTHTWLNENLTEARRKNLNKDAEEGFCELVSYLFMDSLRNEPAKARILRNTYTRGQISLFVAAEQKYGFNDVLEWMKSGADDRLDRDDPDRVRKTINLQRSAIPVATAAYPVESRPVPQKLALKAVFWDETRPTALINDRTFGLNDEGKVRLGNTNVTVRCLAIRKDAVRIRISGSSQEQDLLLGGH